MHIDDCPQCGSNLGIQAFDEDLDAGDEITCNGCATQFALTAWDNGSESGFVFEELTE